MENCLRCSPIGISNGISPQAGTIPLRADTLVSPPRGTAHQNSAIAFDSAPRDRTCPRRASMNGR